MEPPTARGLRLATAAAGRRRALVLLALAILALPRISAGVPSFARQTGKPCSQCHVVAFGVALTAYGRQFKLNGYTYNEGEHPMPLAAMVQGGFTRTSADLPEPAAPHFASTDHLSPEQASPCLSPRIRAQLVLCTA